MVLISVGSLPPSVLRSLRGALLLSIVACMGAPPIQAETRLKDRDPRTQQNTRTDATSVDVSNPGAAGPVAHNPQRRRTSQPDRVGAQRQINPVAVLRPALDTAKDKVAEIEAWNRSNPNLLKEGFVRSFETPARIDLDALGSATSEMEFELSGGLARQTTELLVWTGRVTIADAYRVRLYLTGVTLPKGAEIWVYGSDLVAAGPVGTEVISPNREIWCPSIDGEDVWIEVRVPITNDAAAMRCGFTIGGAVEIFELDERGAPVTRGLSAPPTARGDSSCITDISCFTQSDTMTNASRAIGRMLFISNGGAYVCTGGLLNDQASSGTPYFLTAHHCLETQAEVSSLEVWWDYRTSQCNGPRPGTVERTFGGTLLATSSASDFTFIRLSSIPANRWLMGWTTADPGTATLERVSNPGGGPQVYSQNRNNPTPDGVCSSLPLANFFYEFHIQGGTAGGSSGAPVWMNNTIVVGQLLGQCGTNPSDNCDGRQSVVDGKFSTTYQFVRDWLAGESVALPGTPTGLSTTNISASQVGLSWIDNTTVDVRFKVERRTAATAFVEIGTTGVNTSAYTDSLVQPNTQYIYRVRAQSVSDGRLTEYSAEFAVTTPSAGPAAPTGLFASKIKKKRVDLQWSDAANNEERYEILQFTGSSFSSLGNIGANSTAVRITGLSRQTTYRFAVRSCNGDGCSNLVEISVTTR